MLDQFKHLVSVTCIHDFFGETPYPHVRLVPTSTTEKILKNHRINWRLQQGGFSLIGEMTLIRDILTEPLYLWFSMTLTDPYWSNYTRLTASANTYYTDNLQPDSPLFHSGYPDASNPILCVTEGLEIPDPRAAAITLINKATGEAQKAKISVLRESTAWLHLKQVDEGVYTSPELPQLVFIKTDAAPLHPFLMCQIRITPALLEQDPLKLQLRLPATDVLFRYYLPKESFKNSTELMIVNDQEEAVFGPMQERLVANKPMIHFTSLNAYTYLNHMTESFHLKKKNGSDKAITIFRNLPLPSRENTWKTDDNGHRMIELFIKI